jgi:hypothetical protein
VNLDRDPFIRAVLCIEALVFSAGVVYAFLHRWFSSVVILLLVHLVVFLSARHLGRSSYGDT